MRRSILLSLLLYFGFAPLIHAASWKVEVLSQVNVNKQAQYRFLKFTSSTDQSFYVNSVVLSNNHYHAHIIDQENTLTLFPTNQIYKTTIQNNAFLGINGGFFTPENQPLGLLIIDGKQISKLSPSRLLSGLVLIQDNGEITITDRDASYQQAKDVVQTGPFLMNAAGKIVVKPQDQKDRRTVLALSEMNDLLVLASNETTLFDLATVLSELPDAFGVKKIKIAINLDGGTSTAMSLLLPGRPPLIIPEILPVRSGIIFKLK